MDTSSKKVIYAALTGNTLVAITKFIAASISGSSAMFSEAIHSVVDTGNQALLLYPRKISCQRFLAQALDSTALQKNAHLTDG